MSADQSEYREFVAHRLDGMRRTAYLLCGDWHTADDLVSVALVKLLRHWRRVSTMEHPDAYVRRTLLRAWLDERRRPWRRENPTRELPDQPARSTDGADRLAVLAYLAELPPRRRAVLVLRYFCDLSVRETAAVLNCSEGNVKSQTSRALDTLRARLTTVSAMEER
jgi:RNA polymerase sigma-70 factor (sigma-E family)